MSAPERPGDRRVASDTGLDSNWAGALAYVLGLISGIVFLIVEKKDEYVRFHAMQSLLLFSGVAVAFLIVSGLPVLGRILYGPFLLIVVVVWAALMVLAFLGHRYKLPYVGDLAEQQLKK
jgi:uncharacterized membrane protein